MILMEVFMTAGFGSVIFQSYYDTTSFAKQDIHSVTVAWKEDVTQEGIVYQLPESSVEKVCGIFALCWFRSLSTAVKLYSGNLLQ